MPGQDAKVRVRYAPSPTGRPHLGNLRTALFNWLFARRYGGEFIVRVEDTDRDRYVEGAVDTILESLRWLGLDWDEGPGTDGPYGPYFQSGRLELYERTTQQLVDGGHAYPCYCSRDRLEEMRQQQKKRRLPQGYDRRCRNLSSRERAELDAQETKRVVRLMMPLSGQSFLTDLIREDVVWQNDSLDDFVILKSDGYPTYHLANVVDDHLMGITHVLRAEEWLPSTPRHLQIYEALGYHPPLFAHLPMILGPDRTKLSKRHGARPILAYQKEGYLAEAVVNYMALLGWSFDDKTDIMPRDMLIENFSLDRIGKAGAIFDKDKLLWMNGVYIRQLSEGELAERMLPFLKCNLSRRSDGVDRPYAIGIASLLRERIKTLGESVSMSDYFFRDELVYDHELLVQKGMNSDSTLQALNRALEVLGGLEPFDAPSLEEVLRSTGAELGLSGRQYFGALRVATTGRGAAPPLFETMVVLGKDRCLARIHSAADRLGAAG